MSHIVESCPLTKLSGGLSRLHSEDEDAVSWLTNYGNNNNNNQYIYKQRQSHAMSQRRWLATAVIFRPSDVSLGFAET